MPKGESDVEGSKRRLTNCVTNHKQTVAIDKETTNDPADLVFRRPVHLVRCDFRIRRHKPPALILGPIDCEDAMTLIG
jgi:hypothetical protein